MVRVTKKRTAGLCLREHSARQTSPASWLWARISAWLRSAWPLAWLWGAGGFIGIAALIGIALPASCGDPRTGEGRVGAAGVAGGAAVGVVGPNGGSLSRLLFACVGDTRPPSEDDTDGYPADVITRIFAGIEALRPRPAFALATGDYVFASTGGGQALAQFDIYRQARARYEGELFPAMGNHECTGATTSNCGAGSAEGVTPNYSAFLQQMLAPIQKDEPYYAIRVDAVDRSWTAKFVIVAANAWSGAEASWLESVLAQATTYTFVVRHEPALANTAPGVGPSEAILARHPYTLVLVGHSHTYRHEAGSREVLIGNGGAPLTSKDYGFGVFAQRGDGAIVVDMINWKTGQADAAFHFAIRPDGTATR